MSTHSQAWPNDGTGIKEWCTRVECPKCGKQVWKTNPPMRPKLRGDNGGVHQCRSTKAAKAR